MYVLNLTSQENSRFQHESHEEVTTDFAIWKTSTRGSAEAPKSPECLSKHVRTNFAVVCWSC